MNKRQVKKRDKKELNGIGWYQRSYKELRNLERARKEYLIEVGRKKKNRLDYERFESPLNCIDYVLPAISNGH